MEMYEKPVEVALSPLFAAKGLSYPPKKMALFVMKEERVLELWASDNEKDFFKVTEYPILASSGKLGPKLKEGDRQVPEGIYKIIGFNPNSAFHISMKLNYPNPFDLTMSRKEGRKNPGSDIFIHGNSVSTGCLAMGDDAIEELFTLSYKTGKSNIEVIIFPADPRKGPLVPTVASPAWTGELYKKIEKKFRSITNIKSSSKATGRGRSL
ncbi:MAG: L,D-transpeptidase family protein [Deltaproteobacteria bacterium]|nr:L,D-transpeptidase family protein [Deltaproteobacteria bacterium]